MEVYKAPTILDYNSSDKNVWGPHWWYVLHQISNQYPSEPNRSDRIDFNMMLQNMLRYLPCDNPCKINSKEWISKNPPQLDSRSSLSKWMCQFHNHTREEQGKPLMDCDTILRTDISCPSCKINSPSTVSDSTVGTLDVPVEREETVMRAAEETPEESKPLSHYTTTTKILKESKQKKKELFEALCKEYNDPVPKSFRFEPCHNHPETSCVDFHDPKDLTIYLNPYTDSDRQVFHEFQHYHTLVKTGKISTEDEAEKFAYSRISKAYPLPKNNPLKNDLGKPEQQEKESPIEQAQQTQPTTQGLEASQTRQEEETVPMPVQLKTPSEEITVKPVGEGLMSLSKDESNPNANVGLIKSTQPKRKGIDKTIQDIADNSAVNLAELDTSLEGPSTTEGFDQRFPNYAKLVRESEERKKNELIHKKLNEGFISHLDPIYKYPARALGLKESHMNLAHTPEIVHNIIMSLVQSNTTAVGSGIFSFLTGLSLFALGYFAKSSIAFKDQIALQNVSAAFLWRTLEYINPKLEMKKQLKDLYHRVQEGDLRLSDALIETPGMWRKKEHRKRNAWMYMPHKLGKDEKGRPAFIIPAPYALGMVEGRKAAHLSPTGDHDKNSISGYYSYAATTPGAQSSVEARNIMGQDPMGQDPTYQLTGSTYYDIGESEGDEYEYLGPSGWVDPEVAKNVFTSGF